MFWFCIRERSSEGWGVQGYNEWLFGVSGHLSRGRRSTALTREGLKETQFSLAVINPCVHIQFIEGDTGHTRRMLSHMTRHANILVSWIGPVICCDRTVQSLYGSFPSITKEALAPCHSHDGARGQVAFISLKWIKLKPSVIQNRG